MHKVEINKVVYIFSNGKSALGYPCPDLQGALNIPSHNCFAPFPQKITKKRKKLRKMKLRKTKVIKYKNEFKNEQK